MAARWRRFTLVVMDLPSAPLRRWRIAALLRSVCKALLWLGPTAAAEDHVLFDFEEPGCEKAWSKIDSASNIGKRQRRQPPPRCSGTTLAGTEPTRHCLPLLPS